MPHHPQAITMLISKLDGIAALSDVECQAVENLP
ncbi:hypothetical protein FHU13_005125 [Methylobacterium sp. R2-1]|nr:hypothetical protein [Methylobacterium sp. R2-1]